MNNRLSSTERKHIAAVKQMPCGLCGKAGPSDAHHIKQHMQFIVIPLCRSCHDQVPNGPMWKIMKQTELSVLNQTVRKLLENK